jgi:hypothetical protein
MDVYDDVEELTFPGYLTTTVVASGVSISLRSLYPSDIIGLRTRTFAVQTNREWKEWAVASAVWEIDGQFVSVEDYNAPLRIRTFLQTMPSATLDMLFAATTHVRNRQTRALELLEAYCYEDQSRGRWRMYGRTLPEPPVWVQRAGTNHLQRLWVAYNLAEDDRLQWDNEWYAAKTIAATTAPKWVKQINDQEESRWKQELERRRKVVESATQVVEVDPDAPVVYQHRTNEDLIEQMKRWQRGELDEHDRIVDAYKTNIRKAHDATAKAHEMRMAQLAEAQDMLAAEAPALVAYTPEQLTQMGKNVPEMRKVYDGSHPSRLYDRYLAADMPIGGLRPDGKGGEMQSNLAASLEGRKVVLGGD